MHDTEDKRWWTAAFGPNFEQRFCLFLDQRLGIPAKLNPEKATNPYVPDLIVNGLLADLKAQMTPFMTARRYGCDPFATVTFNEKDYRRYTELYPALDLYWWINWKQPAGWERKVPRLKGVWKVSMLLVSQMINAGEFARHEYKRRRDDQQGNARASYLIPLRVMNCLIVLEQE